AKQSGAVASCAVRARSASSALRLAEMNEVDLILVGVAGPRQLAKLPVSGLSARVVAIPKLGGGRFSPSAWSAAVRLTNGTSSLELGVAPSGRRGVTHLNAFATVLMHGLPGGLFGAGPTPPSQPVLKLTRTTSSVLTVAWQQPTSQPVMSYLLARNGSFVATTAFDWASFGRLACGTTYTLSVQAVGHGGLRSSQSTLTAATAACSSSSGTTSPSSSTATSGSSSATPTTSTAPSSASTTTGSGSSKPKKPPKGGSSDPTPAPAPAPA